MAERFYAVLLRFPAEWRADINRAAKKADMSVTEWIRKAILNALKRKGGKS